MIATLQWLVRRHAGAVLLGFAAAAAALAAPAARVRIDASLENFMMEDDPERIRNREIKRQFSNDEILVVAFDLGRPFEAHDLRRLHELSSAIAEVDGVEETLDLSTIEDVRGAGDTLDASPLVDLDGLESALEVVRARARGHRLYRGNLLSDDQSVLAILVVLEARPAEAALNVAATESILRLLASAELPGRLYLSGYPFSEQDALALFRHDLVTLSALSLLVILAILYALLRRVFPLLLLLALAAWTQLAMLAWFGLSGTPLTLVTAICPPILVVTCATYAVYLFSFLPALSGSAQPGVELIARIARPTWLAALTTMAGFLSLRLMPVAVIGELGTALSLGIGAALLATLLLLPAAVERFGLRLEREPRLELSRWTSFGVRLAERPARTLLVLGALVAAASAGIWRLELDSDPDGYWPEQSLHRRSVSFVRERLSGTFPMNVLVRSGRDGGALEPELLAFADRLVRRIESEPHVDRTISFLDYLWLMDAALNPGQEPRTVLPSRELAAQYLLLYDAGGDPADYRHYIDFERSTLNIWVRMNVRRGSLVLGLRDRIRSWAAEQAPPAVEVEVLGTYLMFPKAMDAISRGMVQGLGLATALVLAVMIAGLGSLRLGLASLIPSVAPILVCLGLMGWLEVPLSFGTSIVGCVSLGLAVDDTAHVLGHLRAGRSLEEVYRAVGGALVLTTLILGAGFSVLAFGSFQPTVYLGIGTVLSLAVALLCNLFALPSILVLLGWPLRAEPLAR
jgi:predicted RND superfamily exporter protein